MSKSLNRIWNFDFQKSLNNASIVSIHKKSDPSNSIKYLGISLIKNTMAKVVANRISKYGIDK